MLGYFMIIKEGASIDKCRAEILIAAITIIEPIYQKYGHNLVITSGTENYKHSAERSRHYSGDALDLRLRFFSKVAQHEIADELQKSLGRDFVVIHEKTHYHVHYAPIYHDV